MKPIPTRQIARLLALLLLILSGSHSQPASAAKLEVGQPAPAINITTLDGEKFDSRSLQGNVVIVTFWATWCSPCRQELPMLSAYAKEHAAQGLRVIAISLDSPDALNDVRALAQQFSFPVALLNNDRLPGYGRLWRLPVSFIIDRQGRLIDNGWDDGHPELTRDRLDKQVTPLLTAGK